MTTKDNKQTIEEYYIQEIHKWQSKLGRAVNLVENTKREYLKVEAFAKECLAVAKADVDDAVKHKAITYDIIKNLKLERDKALKTVKVEPIKLENGKIICQYCGGEFSPQGIKKHEVKCKKEFEKEAEIKRIKIKLQELEKEELTFEQMVITDPTIVKPKPQIKPDLSLQEIKDGREMLKQANSVLAEKETELEQKEGE